MSVKIGNTELKNGIFLAPMAGVSDKSFRRLCRRFGAEYTVSEMVSAKALCYEQLSRRASVETPTAELCEVSVADGPMSIQLFGSEPEFMAEAARLIESREYKNCISDTVPTAIDINMGCPVRKITGNGEGSALMKNPKLAADIVETVVKAVSLPVTVKIRAGWDSESINAPELAKRLESAGASLICVHARTKEQMYFPGIDLSVIERTKASVSIPVIGNGDVYCAEDALKMIDKTGCDGVMIGRGAEGNPWIFAELTACLEGKEYQAPTPCERFLIAREHLDAMLCDKGERQGIAEAKKHMAWYLTGLDGAARARNAVMSAGSRDELISCLESILLT